MTHASGNTHNEGMTLNRRIAVYTIGILMCLASILPVSAAEIVATAPEVLLTDVGFRVTVNGLAADSPVELRINDAVVSRSDGSGISAIDLAVGATGTAQLDVIQNGESVFSKAIPVIPGWVSLLQS